MNKKEIQDFSTQFDAGDVTWEVEETKRRDTIKLILKTETKFNLIKIYLSLKMITEKMEIQLGIMDDLDESDDKH